MFEEDSEPTLLKYNHKGLFVRSWQPLQCEHWKEDTKRIHILDICTIRDKSILLSCTGCDKIYCMNYMTGAARVVFERVIQDPFPAAMCIGPPGLIFTTDRTSGERNVCVFDFKTPMLKLMAKIPVGTESYLRGLCYTQSGDNEYAVATAADNQIICMNVQSKEKVWEKKGKINGKEFDVIEIETDCKGNIFVEDSLQMRRILVLDAVNGNVKSCLDMDKYGNLYSMCFLSNLILLFGYKNEKQKIARLTINF